jgi:hypothetical protein
MKIADAHLELASSHVSIARRETKESLKMRSDATSDAPFFFSGDAKAPQRGSDSPSAQVDLSDAVRKTLEGNVGKTREKSDDPGDDDPRFSVIRALIEFLTGRKLRVCDTRLEDPADAPPRLTYERHESRFEAETLAFSAQGEVRTTDGRVIAFSLDFTVSRSHYEESNVRIQMGATAQKDPLALNFSSGAAEISDTRFQFDLDADGEMDRIPTLKSGSGFLVFDRNGDGRVNDGTELFGALTGDGFGELAAMDEDGNGWIDENDRIYAHLYLWENGAEGMSQLKSLKATDIGAISLTHITTPFSIKNENNASLGDIRSTGIFLMENGGVGTVQKIDLTV